MPRKPTMTQIVPFRLIQTPCCGTLLCFVNPRLPNYCSECGKLIISRLKLEPEHTLFYDPGAILKTGEYHS